MEAQKLSKKSSQNGSPKTFQKKVVPKMEPQKLSKKKWFPKWKPKNCPKKVPKMEASRLSPKKSKMEAQKLAKRSGSQNESPKTFKKKVVPKMEAPKLVKKSGGSQNESQKNVPKKVPTMESQRASFPVGIGFSHQETSMKPHEAHQMPQHGPNIDLTLLNIGQGNDRIIRILMMQSFRWVSLTNAGPMSGQCWSIWGLCCAHVMGAENNPKKPSTGQASRRFFSARRKLHGTPKSPSNDPTWAQHRPKTAQHWPDIVSTSDPK